MSAMTEAFLKWIGGAKSNDQISFTYNPYLACPHVTCPVVHPGFGKGRGATTGVHDNLTRTI